MHTRASQPRKFTALVLTIVMLSTGCALLKRHSDHDLSAAKKPPADMLASVGDTVITAADFKARLSEQPSFSLPRYKSLDAKKQFLDGLARSELLLQEARRRKLESDPEVRAAIEKLLVHKLTETYLDERQKSAGTSDADLHRYYDQHLSDFVTPTRVRISHLFLAVPEKDPRRARIAAEAARLLQQIQARETRGEKQALELTASQRSEDLTTKATGGDLGFRTQAELSQTWGPSFAEAALALKTPGQLGTVVATERGLHLIKLLGRHEGYEVPFDTAKTTIENHLKIANRAHLLDDLTAELKQRHKVHINEGLLSAIDVMTPAGVATAPTTSAPGR